MKNQVMDSKAMANQAVAKKPIASKRISNAANANQKAASRPATKNSLKALAPKWRNAAISGAVGAGIGFAVSALSSSVPIANGLCNYGCSNHIYLLGQFRQTT
jgi:hypothetical protein